MEKDSNIYTTSRGLKLRLKVVPSFIIYDVARKMIPPKPPRTFDSDKERFDDNPLDPAYLEAVQEYENKTNSLSMDTYLVMGTAPVEQELPEGIYPVESEEWSQPLVEEVGLEIPNSGRGRYKAWLKYHALGDMDSRHVIRAVMVFSGVTFEDQVQEAMRSFPSDEGRGASGDVSTPETAEPEHRDGNPNGQGPRDRGEGSGDILPLQQQSMDRTPTHGEGDVRSAPQAPSPDRGSRERGSVPQEPEQSAG